MKLNAFRTYIPKSVDIRPDVANVAWLYIDYRLTSTYFPSAAAQFLNTVIAKTACQKGNYRTARKSDPATNIINGWRRSDVSKRGSSLLPHAVFYWFFRFEPDSSYFIKLAKITWQKDPELFKRFSYTKEGARPNDTPETILDRFRSDEALAYKVILSEQDQQLPATYAAAIELGPSYQAGREEFRSAKKLLLSKHSKSAALTVAVYGAGGYGKSSLSQEICNDDGVRRCFSGGIYWLQFALPDSSDKNYEILRLTNVIDRMLDTQYKKSEQLSVDWEYKDSDVLKLVDILPAERVLLVADDLGTPQQASWLSQVPANVSVLMTTRRRNIARQAAHEITIQRLTHEGSYKLLTYGMTNISPDQQKRFQKLAKGFGGWPLLLGLANGVFKQMDGDPKARIDRSLSEYEDFLADDEIDAWDIAETDEEAVAKRRKFVGFCIEAGLSAIASSNNPDLLRKLAVFPDDADIPFSVTIGYWAKLENEMISKTRGLALLRHFNDFSFFSSFNEDAQSLRLHDEILGYFRACTKDQARSLHGELLSSIRSRCISGWETLPHDHTYGWTQLLHHLEKANRSDEADNLRTDFHWLKAKLASVGASELRQSFVGNLNRKDTLRVGRAIDLSITYLSIRPEALAHQLSSRLSYESDPRLIELTRTAQSDPGYQPVPIKPHLPPIGPELLRLRGHRSLVLSVAFDRASSRIVTASWDRTARLWDAKTGAPIGKPLEGHRGAVTSAAFDRTGRKIVTASQDGTARLWDAETGEPIGKPLEGHDYCLTCAAFDPSDRKIVTASQDGTARLWDAKTGEPIGKPLEGHRGAVTSAAFDPSGRKIVTASRDKTARLWDAETSAPIGKPLEGHRGDVMSAAFDRTGHRVVTASWDKTARLWDAETSAPIGKPFKGHSGPVNHAAFDRTGHRVVTASWDKTARLWDTETSAPIGRPLEGHSGVVEIATFDRTGRKVVTASWDETARLWDAETSAPISKPLEGHRDAINSVAFNRTGRKVVTASQDGTARLWNAETGEPIGKPLEGHRGGVTSAAFDRTGRKIVTASWDETARLWDAETGAPIGKPLEGHRGAVTSAAFDRTGRKIVTASQDGTARLWNAETGAPIGMPLEGHRGGVKSATFDRTGRKVVTASQDGTARLWNAETGASIGRPLEGHRGVVESATFDRTGRRVVTASWDRTLRLWDAETGAPIGRPFEGHDGAVNSVAFNPSRRKIVTASRDETARLWDAETGAPIGKPLEGHRGDIMSATFDRTGRKIVTVSRDGTARLWDAETGACWAVIDFDATPLCVAWHHEHLAIGLLSGRLCLFLTIQDS